MFPIPAIDLKGGKVVRLLQGNFKEEKVYFEKPEAAAKRFEEEGARRIHVVDLDGALEGHPKNIDVMERILKDRTAEIQIGGGIRDLEMAALYFQMGASRVVLGTKACLDGGFMREALKEFGERILIGIDARDGFVATDGWTRVTKIRAVDLAREVEKAGGRSVIYTDILKDGLLKGPNFSEIKALSQAVTLEVIASGGVGSLGDLSALLALGQKNILAVIIGKALYENKFTLGEAIKTCLQKG